MRRGSQWLHLKNKTGQTLDWRSIRTMFLNYIKIVKNKFKIAWGNKKGDIK